MATTTRDVRLRAEFQDKASQGIGQLRSALLGAGAASTLLGQKMMSVGATTSFVGTTMVAVSAGGVLALGRMANAAAQFNQQLALAQTQVDDTAVTLNFLGKTARDIGSRIPGQFEELPRLLFDIFSTVHPEIEQVQGLTEEFMKGATAGFADLQTVSRTSMQVLNAFYSDFERGTDTMGVTVEDATEVLDKQFRMVQRGTGTYQELTQALNRIIPAAQGAGQSVDTMMGSVAFLTRMGVPASMAGTSVARAMESIARSTDELEAAGITVQNSSGEFLQMNDIITQMADSFEGLSTPEMFEELDEIFSGRGWRIQARRFFQLAIPNFEILNQLIQDVAMSSGDMQDAFDQVSDQPALQMQLLQQQFKILVQEIGTEFLPHMRSVIDTGQDLIQWLREVNAESSISIGRMIALASGLLALAGFITMVSGAFIFLRGAAVAASGSISAVIKTVSMYVGIAGVIAAAMFSLAQASETVRETSLDVAAGFQQFAFEGGMLNQVLLGLAVTTGPTLISNWRGIRRSILDTSQSFQSYRTRVREVRAAERNYTRASQNLAQQRAAAAQASSANQAAAYGRVGAATQQVNAAQRTLVATSMRTGIETHALSSSTLTLASAKRAAAGAARILGNALRTVLLNPVTLVIGAISLLVMWFQRSGAAAREFEQDVKTLSSELENAGGQMDELSDKFIFEQLEDLDTDILREAGVEMETVAAAARGNTAALAELESIYSDVSEASRQASIEIENTKGWGGILDENSNDLSAQRSALHDLIEELEEFDNVTEQAFRNLGDVVEAEIGQSIKSTDEYIRAVQFGTDPTKAFQQAIAQLMMQSDEFNDVLAEQPEEVQQLIREWSNAEGAMGGAEGSMEDAEAQAESMQESLSGVVDEIFDLGSIAEVQFERVSGGAQIASNGLSDMLDGINEARQKNQEVMNEARKDVARASDDMLVGDVETIELPDLEIGDLGLGQITEGLNTAANTYEQFFSDIRTIADRGAGDIAFMLTEMGEDGVEIARALAESGSQGFSEFAAAARSSMNNSQAEISSFAKNAAFSLDSWISDMQEKSAQHATFMDNIARIVSRGGGDVVQEIMDMGEQRFAAAEQIANAEQGIYEDAVAELRNIQQRSNSEQLTLNEQQLTALENMQEEYGGRIATKLAEALRENRELTAEEVTNLAELFDTEFQALEQLSGEYGESTIRALAQGIVDGNVALDDNLDVIAGMVEGKAGELERLSGEHGEDIISEVAQGILDGDWELSDNLDDIATLLATKQIAMESDAGPAAQRISEAMSAGILADKTTFVKNIDEYRQALADGLNPVLEGVGAEGIPGPRRVGTPLEPAPRNKGGPIDGPPVDKDVIPAMLTPGEFVLNRDAVRNISRLDPHALHDMNTGKLPGFRTGGFVSPDDVPSAPTFASFGNMLGMTAGKASKHTENIVKKWVEENAIPQLGSGAGWEAMWEIVKNQFPASNLISGFRPGAITATGNPSYHGMGRAIDIDPRMDMFNWLAQNYPDSRELIFSPANMRQIHNGANHMYTGVTRRNHFDHIHWAMQNGGIVDEPTRALIGEAGPEAVIPLDRLEEILGLAGDFPQGTGEINDILSALDAAVSQDEALENIDQAKQEVRAVRDSIHSLELEREGLLRELEQEERLSREVTPEEQLDIINARQELTDAQDALVDAQTKTLDEELGILQQEQRVEELRQELQQMENNEPDPEEVKQAKEAIADAERDHKDAVNETQQALTSYKEAQFEVARSAQEAAHLRSRGDEVGALLAEFQAQSQLATASDELNTAEESEHEAKQSLTDAQEELNRIHEEAQVTNRELRITEIELAQAERELGTLRDEAILDGDALNQRELDLTLAKQNLMETMNAAREPTEREMEVRSQLEDVNEQLSQKETELDEAQQGVVDSQRDSIEATLGLIDASSALIDLQPETLEFFREVGSQAGATASLIADMADQAERISESQPGQRASVVREARQTGARFYEAPQGHYLRTSNGEWYVATGPGQIEGLKALFGSPRNASNANIGMVEGTVKNLFGGAGGIERVLSGAEDLPQLAQGAIARRRAGGTPVVVGEGAHDEAIVPLNGRGVGGNHYELKFEIKIEGHATHEDIEQGVSDALESYFDDFTQEWRNR